MRKAVSLKTAFANTDRNSVSTTGSEIYNKEMKVTNLSVTPALHPVKRGNKRSVEKNAVSNTPRECSICGYALRRSGRCSNQGCSSRLHSKGPSAISSDELLQDTPPPLFHGRKWGNWVFDAERLCLVFEGRPTVRGEGADQYVGYLGSYEIDVEQIKQSSQMLDWIFQVGHHRLSGLLDAFYSIFNPQRNLCSCGCNKIIKDPTAFLKSRIPVVKEAA